jgi:hypothetical protein
VLLSVAHAAAADFATPGGPEPANIDEIAQALRKDPYDIELLISFGTSKGGSAGHLALSIRGEGSADDVVRSANFYADRDPKHEKHHYTADLMVSIPKMEYLYRTSSSLGPKGSFGLDFGEVYKRSVVGIRIHGVPAEQKRALAAFYDRMNDDFRRRAKDVKYHRGEVKYDYMDLNCAKTIGAGFKYGAGYKDLEVKTAPILTIRRAARALQSNIPTEMAMKLLEEFDARGYGMDVVLYRKYAASGYVDPLEPENGAFKSLPNRFPSVLSLDFRNDEASYHDYHNLFAMYLLYNMRRFSVRVNGETQRLEFEATGTPMTYAKAAEKADKDAQSDSKNFLSRLLFPVKGTKAGD